jgi:hypothetical protein
LPVPVRARAMTFASPVSKRGSRGPGWGGGHEALRLDRLEDVLVEAKIGEEILPSPRSRWCAWVFLCASRD